MVGLPIHTNARAERDLIDIWTHIAFDSPAAADRLLDRIQQSWQRLSAHPHSGADRGDLSLGLRSVRYAAYLSFYRVLADEVVVLRVLHGKRFIIPDDIPKL
ncbi:MAG: type II toxin-antitoxin system RelE/ParE family toxin [Mesorhizobium sp.]|nr:type II toxin-antitoxin system RelE/ParE family toxin [Mesorhizobium sp.]